MVTQKQFSYRHRKNMVLSRKTLLQLRRTYRQLMHLLHDNVLPLLNLVVIFNVIVVFRLFLGSLYNLNKTTDRVGEHSGGEIGRHSCYYTGCPRTEPTANIISLMPLAFQNFFSFLHICRHLGFCAVSVNSHDSLSWKFRKAFTKVENCYHFLQGKGKMVIKRKS